MPAMLVSVDSFLKASPLGVLFTCEFIKNKIELSKHLFSAPTSEPATAAAAESAKSSAATAEAITPKSTTAAAAIKAAALKALEPLA